MMQGKLDLSLKRVLKSPVVTRLSKQLTEHLNEYEDRVRKAVKDFDLKSREARKKSRRQIDKFAHQLKSTRAQVEKRVAELIQSETKRMNERAVEIVKYLKTIANGEKLDRQNGGSKPKAAAKAKSAVGRKSSGARKSTSRKTGAQQKSTASGTETDNTQTP